MHPFDLGFAAQESGLLISDNPYPENSTEHEDWVHGFVTAEELPF